MKNVERPPGEQRRWLIAASAMGAALLISNLGGAGANLIGTVLYGVAAVMIGKTLYARQTFKGPALLKQHLKDEPQGNRSTDSVSGGATIAKDQTERTMHAQGLQVCKSCGTRVLPTSAGKCPACGTVFQGQG